MAAKNKLSKETVFSGVAVIFVVTGIVFGWFGKNPGMTASIVSGLAFLFFAHLNQITEFRASASGIEAKTRRLENTVEHAEGVIKELQALAKVVGRTTLSLAIRSGRLRGYGDDNLQQLIKEVHIIFDELGLTEKEKKELTTEVEQFTRFDYVASITGPSSVAYVPKEMVSELKEFRKFPDGAERTEDELREFLERAGQISSEVNELIEDYAYYRRHAKHRRPEVFKERHEWGKLYLKHKW